MSKGYFETVVYKKEGPLGWLTLNRPEVLNIYNMKMRDELFQVLNAVKEDDEVRVIVLSGAGDKAFCAGADLSEFLTAPPPVLAREARWDRDLWGLFLRIPQPVIAVLHGYVLGSGLEMALCCDIRIASVEAMFGLPETGLGIIPAAGATQTMPRTVGAAKALEMLYVGKWINTEEAYHSKLINCVVRREELLETSLKLADRIASLNPVVARSVKQAVNRGYELPLSHGLELEKRLATMSLAKQVI